MKKLTRYILSVLTLWFCFSTTVFAFQGTTIPENVKNSVRERVDGGYNTGIVVVYITENAVDYYCYGEKKIGQKDPVDKNSIFEIGSISKVFTSIILSDMVLKGELNLEDPIEKYLPDDVKVPKRKNNNITLLNLAIHNSGLPRMPNNFKPEDPQNPYADYTVKNMYDFVSGHKLRRDIGGQYEYSNLGMGFLGHLLSLVNGKEYENVLKERICSKIGMENTFIKFNENNSRELASGHSGGKVVSNWDIPTLAGAGAIRSNAVDMVKFIRANLGIENTEISNAVDFSHGKRFKVSDNLELGLAWHISVNENSRIIWHNGGTGGYRAFCGFNKKKKTGAVVLCNSNVSCDDIGFYLLDRSRKLKETKKEVTVAESILEKYVGIYEIVPSFKLTVTRDKTRLFVQATGQSKGEIFAKSETEFFAKAVEATFIFETDKNEVVTGLVLRQSGRDQKAKKIK
ncbi:serine hydrolase [candidate division KSB1 bacterium]